MSSLLQRKDIADKIEALRTQMGIPLESGFDGLLNVTEFVRTQGETPNIGPVNRKARGDLDEGARQVPPWQVARVPVLFREDHKIMTEGAHLYGEEALHHLFLFFIHQVLVPDQLASERFVDLA
jgi:hypothetical protein